MSAPFTVRLEEETLNELDNLAEKTERSRNWLVSRAIESYLSLNALQIAKIEEGIAAADRGDFATDEEMAELRAKLTRDR